MKGIFTIFLMVGGVLPVTAQQVDGELQRRQATLEQLKLTNEVKQKALQRLEQMIADQQAVINQLQDKN